jgi:hypothetical protein
MAALPASIYEHLKQTINRSSSVSELGFADLGSHVGRPSLLRLLDGLESVPAAGCEPHEFRALVIGVVHVHGQAVSLDQVRETLDALPGEAHRAGDLCHRPRRFRNRLHHEPAGQCLSRGPGDLLPGSGEQRSQPNRRDYERRQVVAGRRASGSTRFRLDSMLSYW